MSTGVTHAEARGFAGPRGIAVGAALGGVLLGFLDFVWIKFGPAPFGDALGNSSAVWAVAAFAFGYRVRSGRVPAAWGAALLLVVAVPSYHLAATLIQHDDPAAMSSPVALLWMVFGVLAGVVFGVAGVWARTAGRQRIVGIALPAAVLFAEAALDVRRIGDPSYGDEPSREAVIHAALGVLVVVLVARTNRQRAVSLVVAALLAVVGFVAFTLAGFA